jgi:hypothetical protein
VRLHSIKETTCSSSTQGETGCVSARKRRGEGAAPLAFALAAAALALPVSRIQFEAGRLAARTGAASRARFSRMLANRGSRARPPAREPADKFFDEALALRVEALVEAHAKVENLVRQFKHVVHVVNRAGGLAQQGRPLVHDRGERMQRAQRRLCLRPKARDFHRARTDETELPPPPTAASLRSASNAEARGIRYRATNEQEPGDVHLTRSARSLSCPSKSVEIVDERLLARSN